MSEYHTWKHGNGEISVKASTPQELLEYAESERKRALRILRHAEISTKEAARWETERIEYQERTRRDANDKRKATRAKKADPFGFEATRIMMDTIPKA